MSTISTPLLQDHTLSSVSVTGLFRGGDVFIRDGTYEKINAENAFFDELNVNNLIVNGAESSTGGQMTNQQLGLVPGELVATNATGGPISFPYGPSANQIAIRDSNGSISFTSWVTDITSTFPFFMSTGNGVGYNVGFEGFVNTLVTIPDVGVDANIVLYGNQNVQNVIPSGNNVLHLQSTGGLAKFAVGGPNVTGSTNSASFAVNDAVEAVIQHQVSASNQLSILDSTGYSQLIMQGSLSGNPLIQCGGPFVLTQSGSGGLSNANRASFKALFLSASNLNSIANFTTGITVNNGGATTIKVNTGLADSIASGSSKSFVWTNSFIGANSKFIVSIQDLIGTINGSGVGVPHAIVSSVSPGSATVTIYNISATQTLSTQVTIAFVLFP